MRGGGMALQLAFPPPLLSHRCPTSSLRGTANTRTLISRKLGFRPSTTKRSPLRHRSPQIVRAALPPLDLTEDNIRQVLVDARSEFAQIFDTSAGMTGQANLAELDGPFVKIRLKGRFWHERSLVLARLGTYLKNRIPEILEVDIEDEKQLDDSPENF